LYVPKEKIFSDHNVLFGDSHHETICWNSLKYGYKSFMSLPVLINMVF
jgi:hypothetical protein